MMHIASIPNIENFISSFLIWILFIYFPSLIAMAKISKTMLSNNGESKYIICKDKLKMD